MFTPKTFWTVPELYVHKYHLNISILHKFLVSSIPVHYHYLQGQAAHQPLRKMPKPVPLPPKAQSAPVRRISTRKNTHSDGSALVPVPSSVPTRAESTANRAAPPSACPAMSAAMQAEYAYGRMTSPGNIGNIDNLGALRDDRNSQPDGHSGQEERENSKVQELEAENNKLLQTNNALKQDLVKVREELKKAEVSNLALSVAFATVRKDLATSTTENESLRIAHRDFLLSTSGGSTSSKKRRIDDSVMAEMDMKDVGIMTLVHKRMHSWALRETSEMDFGEGYFGRRWENRSFLSSLYGLRKDNHDKLLVPIPPNVTATRREYFKPSFLSVRDMVFNIVTEQLKLPTWNGAYDDPSASTAIASRFADMKSIQNKLKQTLSDVMSGKKRLARDCLFSILGYDLLLSRAPGAVGDGPSTVTEQIEDARKRLLRTYPGSGERQDCYDFSWWRTAPDTYLQYGGDLPVSTDVVPFDQCESGDLLLKNNVSLRVFEAFTGSEKGGELRESTILVLARLDAWIASVIGCLGMEGGRGGKRQRQYMELFGTYLPVALNQLVGHIRRMVHTNFPSEFEFFSTKEDGTVESFYDKHREVSCVMEYGPQQRRYVAVKSQWFHDYISRDVGIIHDCYLAYVDHDATEVTFLGVTRGTQTAVESDLYSPSIGSGPSSPT